MTNQAKGKGGRPPSVPGGQRRVLYIRVSNALHDRIQAVADAEAAAHPGRIVSVANVVRELLHEALDARERDRG